jgi:RNA polymerase sigma-70 factor (ECF subfamily)
MDAMQSPMSPTDPKAASTSSALVTDETLMRRLCGGSTASGSELVRRYHPSLLRYLQRLSGSDHVAEELHQQTWLSVLEHSDRFDASSSAGGFKAWLFRIATNKAHDHWRSTGRERSAKQGLQLAGEEHAEASDHRLEGTEQQEKLRLAIAQLPDAQREVLTLRYYANLKFVEIAQIVGCPLNTALGRMHKAMLKLKEMME